MSNSKELDKAGKYLADLASRLGEAFSSEKVGKELIRVVTFRSMLEASINTQEEMQNEIDTFKEKYEEQSAAEQIGGMITGLMIDLLKDKAMKSIRDTFMHINARYIKSVFQEYFIQDEVVLQNKKLVMELLLGDVNFDGFRDDKPVFQEAFENDWGPDGLATGLLKSGDMRYALSETASKRRHLAKQKLKEKYKVDDQGDSL